MIKQALLSKESSGPWVCGLEHRYYIILFYCLFLYLFGYKTSHIILFVCFHLVNIFYLFFFFISVSIILLSSRTYNNTAYGSYSRLNTPLFTLNSYTQDIPRNQVLFKYCFILKYTTKIQPHLSGTSATSIKVT